MCSLKRINWRAGQSLKITFSSSSTAHILSTYSLRDWSLLTPGTGAEAKKTFSPKKS